MVILNILKKVVASNRTRTDRNCRDVRFLHIFELKAITLKRACMLNFATRYGRRNNTGTIVNAKRYVSSLRDDRGMEFSSSKLYHGGDNILEDTVASMNIAVEALQQGVVFFTAIQEKNFWSFCSSIKMIIFWIRSMIWSRTQLHYVGWACPRTSRLHTLPTTKIYHYGLILVELKIVF